MSNALKRKSDPWDTHPSLDDNSGVYIRVPPANTPNALGAADQDGYEIQIDERGYDSATNTTGNAIQRTGAI